VTLDIARQVEPRWNPGTRKVVGATGFEPATPCAQGRCATRLRYAPTIRPLSHEGRRRVAFARDARARAARAGKWRSASFEYGPSVRKQG
jgi:hypothetical protein